VCREEKQFIAQKRMLCFQLVEEHLGNANIDPKESNHLPVTNERAVDETDRVEERQNLEKRSRK
jgi:hypothetical protein